MIARRRDCDRELLAMRDKPHDDVVIETVSVSDGPE